MPRVYIIIKDNEVVKLTLQGEPPKAIAFQLKIPLHQVYDSIRRCRILIFQCMNKKTSSDTRRKIQTNS